MTKILIAYHSHDGQTTKIAGHLALRLRERGFDVEEFEARHAPTPDKYDVVVVGDSIRLGRHSKALTRYLRRHREVLFQVSMTSAGHDAEHVAEANRLLARLVERTGLHPSRTAAFAGALRYSEYGWVTQRVMRSIARREGNATDMTRDHEYTDWQTVDAFAAEVASLAPTEERRSEVS
jgi:menaquinone-dependent protoporphyrinogen oxidase